jgi:beta-lactam-binding protein with PASTA domain
VQKILSDVARIDPRPTERHDERIRWVAPQMELTSMVPDVAGLSPGLARRLLKQEGLMPQLVGRGTCVVTADPGPGSSCKPGATVRIVLGEAADSLPAEGTLPDFHGLSLRDAVARARWFGLPLEVRGAGWVVNQDPGPGIVLTGVRRLRLDLAADSCEAWTDFEARRR